MRNRRKERERDVRLVTTRLVDEGEERIGERIAGVRKEEREERRGEAGKESNWSRRVSAKKEREGGRESEKKAERDRKGGMAVEEVINGNEDCLAKCEWATGAGIWMEKDGRSDGWIDGWMDGQTVVYGRMGIASITSGRNPNAFNGAGHFD